MKLLIICLLIAFNIPTNDLNNVTHPYSIQLVATVQEKNEDFVTLHVDEVLGYGSKIYVLPQEGDELTVRLPASRSPQNHATIVIELRERISVGANPCSYIMLDYRTVD